MVLSLTTTSKSLTAISVNNNLSPIFNLILAKHEVIMQKLDLHLCSGDVFPPPQLTLGVFRLVG